jgi:DNA repair protein RecO (recombination protein O)
MGSESPIQPTSDRRQRSFRVEGVVLRHLELGEADRLLTLYTLEMGKLSAIAKGVRKPLSRKAGHLEPFTRVSLQLARGRNLMIITQAVTVEAYQPLREDLLLTTYASYVVELLDRFTYEEGENRATYRLLANTLERLCTDEVAEIVVRYYEMRLLDLIGYRPQLSKCVNCESEIQAQDQYFSAERGGVICPRCDRKVNDARPVSVNALKYFRHLQRSNFPQAARIQLTPRVSREMENLMQHYLTYLLERGLNSPEFLRRLRRMEDS